MAKKERKGPNDRRSSREEKSDDVATLPWRADGSELRGRVATAEPGTEGRQSVGPFKVAEELVDTVAALPHESHLEKSRNRHTSWPVQYYYHSRT